MHKMSVCREQLNAENTYTIAKNNLRASMLFKTLQTDSRYNLNSVNNNATEKRHCIAISGVNLIH